MALWKIPKYDDFIPTEHPLPSNFYSLYEGKFGGKAKGLIYAKMLLDNGEPIAGEYTKYIKIPPSLLVGDKLFDELINQIKSDITFFSDEEIMKELTKIPLPSQITDKLNIFLNKISYPLAIRSSSLLEDNSQYSFAGIYLTLFIANKGDFQSRYKKIENSIKRVIASTFSDNAKKYRKKKRIQEKDEKMAALIQELIGKKRGFLYYPTIAGIAFSINVYPWSSRISPTEPVVRLVYGLGTRAVGRNYARLLSLFNPGIRPEGNNPNDIKRYAQEYFDALNIEKDEFVSLHIHEILNEPEHNLHIVASTMKDNDYLTTYETYLSPSDKIILTFDPIIETTRWFPLLPLLQELLKRLSDYMGMEIDLEFAVEFNKNEGTFYILQIRPLTAREEHTSIKIAPPKKSFLLAKSNRVLGNGIRDDIKYIIYLKAENYDPANVDKIVRTISNWNESIGEQGYILIGPGRWGTANHLLGVPIHYAQITNASVIIETARGRFAPELSYGTHFFADLLANSHFYLSVIEEKGDYMNYEFLDNAPFQKLENGVKIIKLDKPAYIAIDGKNQLGLIAIKN